VKNKAMRVLMTLMGMEIGGAETHVLELSKTLSRMGLDVHVVSNGGVYVSELAAAGIKHYDVPLHNKQLANVSSSYRALRKIIIDNDIRLVHAHARIPAFICGRLQKRLRKTHPFKLVTTAHFDFNVAFPFNKLSNWGDKTLAVSRDIKEYLLKNYKLYADNIALTVNGIDVEKFAPGGDGSAISNELGLSASTAKIVSISRLDTGPSLPAHLLIALAQELPTCEIIIVGDGDDFAAVKSAADAMNDKLQRRAIHITGRRTDIPQVLACADFFVNVSRGALEAMACGIPGVLGAYQGYLGIMDEKILPAAVDTNFTCRGTKPMTLENLRSDLRTLLAMPDEQRTQLGQWCRDTVTSQYSLTKMAQDAIALYKRVQSPQRRVVISGYYGYNNSGDDVMLQSIIAGLHEKHDNLRLTVLSRKPGETRARFGVDAVGRFNILRILSRLRGADMLITGGGNLVQDETSTQSLLYYLWVIGIARRMGAKNMLYAKGIGPVNRPQNIRRVQKSLQQVDLITLREPGSKNILSEMGVTRPSIHVTADAAFALAPSPAPHVPARYGITGQYFCIALRHWMTNPPELEAEVARFADTISQKYGYTAVFVLMRAEQDGDISRRTMALMRSPAVLAEPPPGDVTDTRAILGGARFTLAMRLHAIIYAMEYGVPAIGLVYSPKIRQFMQSVAQESHMPVEDASCEILLRFAHEIEDNHHDISHAILDKVTDLRQRARENARLAVSLLEG
jgi:polysaccharide pyruvyl transferase CsaB